MKLYAFVLLALAISATEGRRFKNRKYAPTLEGPCDLVQAFDPYFVYTYKYVVETRHYDTEEMKGSSVRINCTATITVPQKCSAKMRVSDCSVEETLLGVDGRPSYRLLPQSESFNNDMSVYETAFQFNGGQITNIYVDKQERTNITNFKRGILSSLQAFSPIIPRQSEIGDVFEIPQVNIYGQGKVQHKVIRKLFGLPSGIEVVRDASKIKLPWERKQWNFLRMQNNKANPLVAAIKDYVTMKNDEMWAKPKQTCVYELARGRQIVSGDCYEQYPLNPTHPLLKEKNTFETNPLRTTIHQKIDSTGTRPMTARDRSRWNVTRFDEDNLMFEEEWEETHSMFENRFDAQTAFMSLVRNNANERSPALISKLARWMTIASQENIEAVWTKCENECDKLQKEEGRTLWAELLDNCVSNDWCEIPYCSTKNLTSCEKALETFVVSNGDKSPKLKYQCLEALGNVYAPSEKMIGITLRICRAEERETAECVKTVGNLVKNFYDTCDDDCLHKKPVENAKSFLEKQLKRNCRFEREDKKTEEVIVKALEAVGRLGRFGNYALDTVFSCAMNEEVISKVQIKALIAYSKITEENIDQANMRRLVQLFGKSDAPLEVRITIFHFMMKKNLSESDLRAVYETIMHLDQHDLLAKHCKNDIRVQMMLRGTQFCQYYPRVTNMWVDILLEGRLDVGLPREVLENKPIEKSYEMDQKINIPVLNMETDCSIKFDFVYESKTSMIPVVVKLTVGAKVEGQIIKVIEAAMDVAGLKQVIDRIFGEQMVYAELLNKLLKTPVGELGQYTQHYPAMHAITAEGKYAYVMDMFTVRSPFAVKVFGYDIGIESLFSFESIKKITLERWMDLVKAMKEGIEQDILYVGQPFVMQHATPTSIGSPMVSTIDFTYMFKNKMNLKADLLQLFWSTNERGTIEIFPDFHITGSISRVLLRQFTKYSGTEVEIRMGHNSGTSCVLDKTTHGVEMSCTPKEGTSRVLYMSALRKLIGDITPPREIRCNDYRLRDLYHARKCQKDWTASGFVFEFTMEHEVDAEYRVYFEKSRNPEARDPLMKTWVAKVIAKNRSKPRARKDLWSSTLSVIAERNQIELDVESVWFSWKAFASARMPTTGSLRGLYMSFNCSNFNDKTLKYWNWFNFKPITEKKYVLDGEFKRVKSDNSFKGVIVSGLYNEAAQGAKTDRVFHLDFKDIESPRSPKSLFGISFETTKKSQSNLPGYETKFLVQGTILPLFEKYVFEMGTYDNKLKFDQVMRVSAHYHEASENPLFFFHKLSGHFKQLNQQAYNSKYYCISNWFQCEYNAVADNDGNLNTLGKVNVAKRSIRLDEIITGSQTDIFNYNFKFVPTEPKVFHWQYIKDLVKGRDRRHYLIVDYPTWDSSVGKYVQVQGTVNFIKHSYCSYCHTFEIKHPMISFTSISKRNEVYHEEKWFEIHYSLFNYVPMPVFVKHYIFNSLENGLLQLGYKMVFSTVQSEHRDVAIVKYAFFKNIIDCQRVVSHGYDVQNMTCLIDLPIVYTYVNLKSYAEGLADGPKINMDSSLEIRYYGMKVYGTSIVSKVSPQNYKWVTKGAYGWLVDMEKATEFDIEIVLSKNGLVYDITGKWESVYKKTGVTKVSRILGSSHKTEGLRDLEINVMCDETSDRVCNRLRLNKEFWIEYERRAEGEHFDRLIVTNTNGRYAFSVDIYEASLFGLNKFTISWERGPRYEFEIMSPLLNASYSYNSQNGLRMSYAVITPIYSYGFLFNVDGNNLMYNYMYDTRKLGGERLTSSMSLNYKILRWEEAFSGDFMFGVSPESFGFKFNIPDFSFAWKRTSDLTEPTLYRKHIDLSYVPRKLTINKFTWVLFERMFEITNTVVGVSLNQDGGFGSFDITNINVNLEPECLESKPVVITGNVKITRTAVLFKISDPDRFFVFNVDIDSRNLLKQHIEFNWHFFGAQVVLLWDYNQLQNKFINMECKATISTKCWKTKKMTPIIDFNVVNKVTATVEPNNFPTITMMWKFAHALPIWFIPSESLMTLDTVHTTELTTMNYFVKFNKRTYTESHWLLNGCYSEYIMLEGYKICWPNTLQLRTTTDIPYFLHYVHVMDVSKDSRGEWIWSNIFNVTSPMTGFTTSTATTSMAVRVIQWKATPHGVSFPTKIDLKEISAYIPSMYDRFLMGWYHPNNYRYEDIILENGHALILHAWTDEYRTIDLQGVLLRRGSTVEIPVILKNKFMANSVSFNSTIVPPSGRMSHSLEASYVPNTWGWMYKQILDMPRWYTRFEIVASSPLSISSFEWEMRKPEGLLRKLELSLKPGNLRCVYNLYLFKELGDVKHFYIRDRSTGKWNLENSATFPSLKLTNTMVVNGFCIESMDLNLSNGAVIRQIKLHWANYEVTMIVNVGPLSSTFTKRARIVDFNMNWENCPYLTQTMHLTYDTEEIPNYVVVYDNMYYQCTVKFAAKQMRVQGQLLDCTMKSTPTAGLRVEYLRDDNEWRCNMLFKTYDNKRISCLSTPMRSPEMEADLSCYIVEGSRNDKFTTVRVTMEDFPFMYEKMTRDKVLFLSRFFDLWMKASRYSDKQFGQYFQTNLQCTRKEICYDLARRVKVIEETLVKEMRRIIGQKFVYLSDPALLEYAIYEVISLWPGSFQLLPQRQEWNDKSVTANMNEMINGKPWKLFKWSFAPWVDGTAGIQMLDKDDLRFVAEFKSSMYNWLNYKVYIGTDLYEGHRVLNFTTYYLGWTYGMILGREKGKLYPIAEEYCTKDCYEGLITEYDWSVDGDRHKIVAYFVREGRLAMDRQRQHLIGDLSIPALSQVTRREQISMDSLLRDVLHMQYQRHRSKFTAHVNKMVSQVATSITKTLPISKSSMLTANIAQYAFASGVYEVSKYGSIEDIYESLRKFSWDLINFEVKFSEFVENLWELLTGVAGGQLNSESYGIPLRKILFGELGIEYGMENNAFVFRYRHALERYPSLSVTTATRFSQPARNTLVMITEFVTKYLTISVDNRLVGKRFFVEKINIRVTGMNKDLAEIRFLPDPVYPERSVIELYFSDLEGNRYGCRGIPMRYSPLIHVHCYETLGSVLPPNPLPSKMMSYWDIYVEVVPLWSSRAVTEFFNAVMSLRRGMSICRQNTKYIDTVLLDVYHVSDITIRKRLVATVTETCRRWTSNDAEIQSISEFSESQEEEVYEQELGYETFQSQYKYAAYDTLQKYVTKEFVTPSMYAFKIVDIEILDLMFKSFINYSAPFIHDSVSTLRFLEPFGFQIIDRCSDCRTKPQRFLMTSLLKSPKLSLFNHEFQFLLPKRGDMMNMKLANDWMWLTTDLELVGYWMTPKKCAFGLARSASRGVEVLFYPQLPSGERPTMSFLFYLENSKYCCDATVQNITLTKMTCKQFESDRRGTTVATCKFTPMKTWKMGWELVMEGCAKQPNVERIGNVIEEVCEVTNPTFKTTLSTNVVSVLQYMTDYFVLTIKETLKVITDILKFTHASMWEAFIDLYDYWSLYFPQITDAIKFMKIETLFDFWVNLSDVMQRFITVVYKSGYVVNDFFYKLPEYIRTISGKLHWKYAAQNLDYVSIVASNMLRSDECTFGIVSTPQMENIMSLNGHYYRIPRDKMAKCPYDMAADVVTNTFSVLHVNEDIVINLPELSFTVDRDMKIFTLTKQKSKIPMTLPMYNGDVSCIAINNRIYCNTPYLDVIFHGRNNKRMAVFVKLAITHCSKTRGMAGIGGKSDVPEMPLPNGQPAGSLEQFVNAYSTDKTCRIDTIQVTPDTHNRYCERLFQSPELVRSCPKMRMSFMKTCDMASPTTELEACVYARLFVWQCNAEGRPTMMPRTCETCKGGTSTAHKIEKVIYTVVMSLSRSYDTTNLQEILNTIRRLAVSNRHNYEVNFVTYGGQGRMYGPALYFNKGMSRLPRTLPWTLPSMERNGEPAEIEPFYNTLWFAMMNAGEEQSVSAGVGRVFLLASPESLDYSALSASTCVNRMKQNLIETYLLVPKTCNNARTRTPYGVRRLFVTDSRDVCSSSVDDIATAMNYHNYGNMANCQCDLENPYTGQTKLTCHAERPRA